MAADDYPLIAWNDGSAPLTQVEYLPYEQFLYTGGGGGDNTLAPAANLPADGVAYTQAEATIAKMNTGRSVDRSRTEFVLKFNRGAGGGFGGGITNSIGERSDFAVVFGVLDLSGVMCAVTNRDETDTLTGREPFYGNEIDRTRSFAFRCPTERIITTLVDGTTNIDSVQIVKTGLAEIVEIITQNDPMTLPIPPQSKATPSVNRRWETNPKTSVRGDYLGASARPIAGQLTLDMDNLSREWIESRWEPFREHVSKGGVFAYIDREGQEPAYCYAAANVPAPVIKAGGYGKVMLRAGVAVL